MDTETFQGSEVVFIECHQIVGACAEDQLGEEFVIGVVEERAEGLDAGDFVGPVQEVAQEGVDDLDRDLLAMEEFFVFQEAGMGNGPVPCGREGHKLIDEPVGCPLAGAHGGDEDVCV